MVDFRGDERAQSSTVGFALVFFLVLAGSVTIVVLGATALSSTQEQAELEQAGQAMTQFDSTAAKVALGDTDVQSVAFGRVDGTYDVDPDAGHVTITHYDYDGNGNDKIIEETDLGAVVYERRGTTIAYQGGGVWRSDGARSGSRMISPPEFHYRGATLTFPIVTVTGDDGASGETTATVTKSLSGKAVYPSSRTYPGGEPFKNPQSTGHFEVEIQSRYYEGWAQYFRARTAGDVTVTEAPAGEEGTVTVELISLGTGKGEFQMPPEGEPIELRGLADGHALKDFNLTVRPDDADSASFNNLQWSLYAEGQNGKQQLELHLRQNQGGDCDEVTVDAIVYYTEDGTESDPVYHGWIAEEAFRGTCEVDEDGDQSVVLVANWTSDSTMTYRTLGSDASSQDTPPKPNQGTLASSATFDEHPDDLAGDGTPLTTYNAGDGDTETMSHVVGHYFGLFGSQMDLVVYDKSGGSLNEGTSSGYVDYGGTDYYVTYLHVTENEVAVEFN